MASIAKRFDCCVPVSSPLGPEALEAIPAKRGVFALLAGDDRPILLTTAADIRARLRHRLTAPEDGGRRKTADLRAITAAVCWQLTYSRFETDWRFFELARAIWPETYTQLLPRRSVWFVAARADGALPHLAVVREGETGADAVGPFLGRRSAGQFAEALADAFDLCRCYAGGRKRPEPGTCAYKEMGRCAAPCDGSASMDACRRTLAEAMRFAAGDRAPARQRLAAGMREAAAAMDYERAAVLKARLARLAQFDSPRFADVRDTRALRLVGLQRGPTFREMRAFVCDRGALAEAGTLGYPPVEAELTAVLDACDALSAGHGETTPADRRRLALVSAYLLSGKPDRGLWFRRDEVTAAGLTEAIEAATEALKVRRPARRRARAAPAKQSSR